MGASPWLKTVTAPTAGVAVNLFTLIQAADATIKYPQCCKMGIQLDPSMAAAKLRIGNADISTVNAGAALVAGQVQVYEMTESNLYSLRDVWLLSDTNATLINVTFVVH